MPNVFSLFFPLRDLDSSFTLRFPRAVKTFISPSAFSAKAINGKRADVPSPLSFSPGSPQLHSAVWARSAICSSCSPTHASRREMTATYDTMPDVPYRQSYQNWYSVGETLFEPRHPFRISPGSSHSNFGRWVSAGLSSLRPARLRKGTGFCRQWQRPQRPLTGRHRSNPIHFRPLRGGILYRSNGSRLQWRRHS